MRIVRRNGETPIAFGKEDIVLLAVFALIVLGLVIGQLTIQEALGYFGVSGAGGVWGMLGGNASEK